MGGFLFAFTSPDPRERAVIAARMDGGGPGGKQPRVAAADW